MARLILGIVGFLVMMAIGIGSAWADPDPTYHPLPPISDGLPTVPPALPIYITNPDGTRTECVALDQALSCDWK